MAYQPQRGKKATEDRLIELMGLGKEMAVMIAAVINTEYEGRQELADELVFERDEEFPLTSEWVRKCYNTPNVVELKVHMIDEALGTYGVVGVQLDKLGRDEWFQYCNQGDPYEYTVAWCPVYQEWIITAPGDYQEWAEIKGWLSKEV